MKRNQAEAWALQIIDRLQAGQPVEDMRVELKAGWIDPHKAARRLAGHANAARGDDILWLIGVSDETGKIVGADQTERADWLHAATSSFEDVVPDLLCDLNIPVDGKSVVALVFATDRAPYVVKNPSYGRRGAGPISLEIPWRQGTAVRSANRQDLLRILLPASKEPEIEALSGELRVTPIPEGNRRAGGPEYEWGVWVDLYIIPRDGDTIVIPFHRCTGQLDYNDGAGRVTLKLFRISTPKTRHRVSQQEPVRSLSVTAEDTPSEFIIMGPTKAVLIAKGFTRSFDKQVSAMDARLTLSLFAIGCDRHVRVSALLWPVEVRPNDVADWIFES